MRVVEVSELPVSDVEGASLVEVASPVVCPNSDPTDVPESPPESGCPAADSTAKLASRPIAKMLAATPPTVTQVFHECFRRGRSTVPASWVGSWSGAGPPR